MLVFYRFLFMGGGYGFKIYFFLVIRSVYVSC